MPPLPRVAVRWLPLVAVGFVFYVALWPAPAQVPLPPPPPPAPRAAIPQWNELTDSVAPPGPPCDMRAVRQSPANAALTMPYRMCLRTESDLVSNQIRTTGRWPDCDSLVALWRRAPPPSTAGAALFVDIGANIGACSLLMAALVSQAPAQVVAFEPVPQNLHYLTQSIRAAPEAMRQRLRVHPVACGAQYGLSVITMERGNAGNSVIGHPTQAAHGTRLNISVVPCDDALWPPLSSASSAPPPVIHVMKLDAQGYELLVLDGLQRLLRARAIGAIKAEIATQWLQDHGASALAYCRALMQHGFRLTHSGAPVDERTCRHWDTQRGLVTDIEAVLV